MTFYLTGQIPSGKNQQGIRDYVDPKTQRKRYHKYGKKRFVLWKKDAAKQLVAQRIPSEKIRVRLGVELIYTPMDRRTRDVPGILDALWHLLQHVGFVDDDKWLGKELQFKEMPPNKNAAGVVMKFWKLPT